jgi:hypothetical protein
MMRSVRRQHVSSRQWTRRALSAKNIGLLQLIRFLITLAIAR